MGRFVLAVCLTITGIVVVSLNIFWWLKRGRRFTGRSGRSGGPSVVPVAAPILAVCAALLETNRWFLGAVVAISLVDPGSWILVKYLIQRPYLKR